MAGRLSEFIMTIAATAMVCTLLEYLVPNGRLKSSVRIGAGLVFLLAISAPLVAACTKNDFSDAVPDIPAANIVQQPLSHYDWLKELYEKQGILFE